MTQLREDWIDAGVHVQSIDTRERKKGMHANDAIALRTKRKLEKRELLFYSAVGFMVFFPLVTMGRLTDLLRGRGDEHRGSIIEETNAKVGGMLGFVFMA